MKKLLQKVNWVGALFLTLSPVAAILFGIMHIYLEGFRWSIWIFAAIMYALTACSITGGYHRYFSHRAYECRTWLKWFWALFGAASFQNSILIWARDHRMHHRFVDTDLDPYSIKKGFWYAHIGWMLVVPDAEITTKAEPYGRDLERDPIVMFQHNHYVSIAIIMGLLMPAIVGHFLGSAFGGLAIAGFARIVALHHATFFINSACHWWGRQTYTDENSARDSILMAVATFGEGYHNYHHIFASDYRNGIRWYHWDPTKWIINLFHLTGGAHSLRRTPWSEILKAQMQMDEKVMKDRLKNSWQSQFQVQLDALRAKIVSAQQRFEQVRDEYRKSAAVYKASSLERFYEVKNQVAQARRELKLALAQWREYKVYLMSVPVPVIAG